MNCNRRALLVSAFVITVAATSCTSTNNAPTASASNSTDAASPAAMSAGGDLKASLSGAGASFPAPLYQRWFSEFNKQQSGVQISYQSVGSGAGVEQYLAGTVDFGASDAPLTDEEKQSFKAKYGADPIQVPMTGGAVVLAYNLPGVQDLKVSREAFCGIVQGTVTRWNDPAIAQANTGATLPDQPIGWVHRSDGSGTTFIFSSHIAAACPNWTAGSGKSVEWPVGAGAKGNEGVTAQIQQTEGSIGYVEYAYAHENELSMAELENKAGKYIAPSPESAALAFEGEEVPADFALSVPDPSGEGAYPIAGLTWLLLYPKYADTAKLEALKAVIDWSLAGGKTFAQELGYVPVTEGLAQRVMTAIDQIKG
ncbi:MAG TPA: phosphate ABC transporter substrate-binding protein PstS [Chroococcidiopsis sp.]